jgi:hypothetical protein
MHAAIASGPVIEETATTHAEPQRPGPPDRPRPRPVASSRRLRASQLFVRSQPARRELSHPKRPPPSRRQADVTRRKRPPVEPAARGLTCTREQRSRWPSICGHRPDARGHRTGTSHRRNGHHRRSAERAAKTATRRPSAGNPGTLWRGGPGRPSDGHPGEASGGRANPAHPTTHAHARCIWLVPTHQIDRPTPQARAAANSAATARASRSAS